MTPFAYLPRSIIAFYPSQEFTQIMGECGFSDVAVHPMTMGVATVFTAQK
jgi:ubiquinone/menaquinone biosynthesis C-methylase UbiE